MIYFIDGDGSWSETSKRWAKTKKAKQLESKDVIFYRIGNKSVFEELKNYKRRRSPKSEKIPRKSTGVPK